MNTYTHQQLIDAVSAEEPREIDCPRCAEREIHESVKESDRGNHYNHLLEVIALIGSNDEGISTGSVSINTNSEIKHNNEVLKHWARLRGLGVLLMFACEHGHRWCRKIYFHKGNSYEENAYLGRTELSKKEGGWI